MWLKCMLRGTVFPPTLAETVWVRREPLLLINDLTVLRSYRLLSLPVYPLHQPGSDPISLTGHSMWQYTKRSQMPSVSYLESHMGPCQTSAICPVHISSWQTSSETAHHMYADDTQLYATLDICDETCRRDALVLLTDYIAEMRSWLSSNLLQLNDVFIISSPTISKL